MKEIKTTGVALLTLLLSMGTLVCCVLPVILVSLGLGAALTALISQLPFLVTLSQYKLWIFVGSALLLAITAWLLWRPSRSCPADAKLAALCGHLMRWNKRIFWAAVIIWLIGFTVTYIVLPLWIWIEN